MELTIKKFISNNEGRRNKPYKCPAGCNTIGVGWNMDAHPLPAPIQEYLNQHGEITEEMIDNLLEISILSATADCEDLFPDFDNFSNVRRIALVDFLFNIGKKKAMQFAKSIHKINIGHWQDAAEAMRQSLWAKQVKSRAVKVIDMIERGIT